MNELGLDVVELQAAIREETEAALKIGDDLAAALLDIDRSDSSLRRAREYQEKRLMIRRLRRTLADEVSG